jgi:lactoylglutathione lyase
VELSARIDTVIVCTGQLEALGDFYRQGLGLKEPERLPRHLGFQLEGVYLGFDQVDERAPGHGAVSFWVRVDDLDATFARLVALGGTPDLEPVEKPWGDRIAAVIDPDGNRLGLSQAK